MSKKHFIALADAIIAHNARPGNTKFTEDQLNTLVRFMAGENPRFDSGRWLGYIEGKNGPSGGKVE